MGKKISLAVVATLMAITAAVTFSITILFSMQYFNQKVQSLSEREATYAKLAEVDGIVRGNVNGTIDETALNDSIAAGYMRGLGSGLGTYYSASSYASYLATASGQITGIGIETVAESNGYRKITAVYAGSPAEESGLMAQDLIVKVDDTDLANAGGVTYDSLMAGDVGSNVTLTIRRGTEESTVTLTRRNVTIQSVYSRIIADSNENNVGYIKIKTFDDQTLSQFISAFEGMRQEGISRFVFDVRENSGGSLEVAASVLDKLLPDGVLVSYRDKDGNEEVLYESNGAGTEVSSAVVLVGSGTAAEGELFAAAISDAGYGKIVGSTTAGDGGYRRFYRLNDGSAIQLNVGTLLTGSGTSFDGTGVKLDFTVELASEQKRDMTTLTDDNDTQLNKALEILVTAQ